MILDPDSRWQPLNAGKLLWKTGREITMKYSKQIRLGLATITALIWAATATAESLPEAVKCYRDSTRSKDIEAYMNCFADNPVMIDVSRTIEGKETIREWALREVIPYGDQFTHNEILERNTNYVKTLVRWMVWNAHYYYWWDEKGKITKMSLQYAD